MQISFTVCKLDWESWSFMENATTNLPTRGWSQSHVNSLSQLAPMYHNVLAQTSQGNLLQQQQQQQSNNQQQPMQSQQYYCYPTNIQGSYGQNQYGQPYQPETYGAAQPQQQIPRSGIGSIGQPIGQTAYNMPSIMQNQIHGYGSLPAHILDQIRAYIGTPSPIFILPNNCPSPTAAPAAAAAAAAVPQAPCPPMAQGCPGIGLNCPSAPIYCSPNSCYPYTMPVPVFNPFATQYPNNSKDSTKNCGCCAKRNPTNPEAYSTVNYNTNDPTDEHHCTSGNDDTVCTKRNCPSAINLQALASQLLAIQGIIPCAATRLVLRKVAGSNITSTVEETIERAKRSLNTLTQEQLLSETRHAQQVNALINLHMTANPPPNVVPILTTIQLKINLLKAHVDSSINRRLSDNQGTEGNGILDPVVLALKSDQELRDLLGTLRQKECDERVNRNFAPYQSQRIIADNRLSNVQNKITQVEAEMNRRRGAIVGTSMVAQQLSDPGWYGYVADISNTSSSGPGATRSSQNYESPDPFQFQHRNPKRLYIKPHVGSPETTYERKKSIIRKSSRTRKDSDDDDCVENSKNFIRDENLDDQRCACEKSSDDESADEDKKKLGGKIVVEKDREGLSVDDERVGSGVSIVKLSRNVVIVIDNPCGKTRRNKTHDDEIKTVVAEKVKSDDVVGESDKIVDSKNGIFAGTMITNGVESIATGKTDVKTKRFKWGWKRDKIDDVIVKNENFPEAMENRTTKIDENCDAATSEKMIERDRVDYFRDSDGPEPIREQTVQMITKIDYEPSVFRAFLNAVDEPPEKDRVDEEPRFEGSSVEDSMKSISIESTVDSERTTDPASLRVEGPEEASPCPARVADDVQHIVEAFTDRVLQKTDTMTKEENMDDEGERINGKTVDKFRRLHRSGPSHNDVSEDEDSISETNHRQCNPINEKQRSHDDNLISGALTTIGNHVASFGSIIGKIAAMKLHRYAESSQMFFRDNSTPKDASSNVNAGASEIEVGETSTKSRIPTKKDRVTWKYVKFAETEGETSESRNDENDSMSEPYTLPKIKQTIIEDNDRGSKYVLIDEPSPELRRELGEPSRTERSLIIRSRPRSESPASERSEPFAVVEGPTRRRKNCVALHFVTPKSSGTRCNENRDIKSSEKFWFRPEKRDQQPGETTETTTNSMADRSTTETSISQSNYSVDDEKSVFADSGTSVNDEHVVRVHEYSKIPIFTNRAKLFVGSAKK